MRRENLAPGCEIEPFVVDVTRALIEKFTLFANDRNAVHYDDRAAREQGFPAAIVHGAVTASFISQALMRWLDRWPLPGDECELKFVSPAFIGETLTVRGIIESVHSATAFCKIWCESESGTTVIAARASIRRLPEPDPAGA